MAHKEMDQFAFMKECLEEFNYPKIHTMDDSEVADIFSTVNRQFLVTWIFKQINEDYNKFVEKYSKEEIGNLVYNSGFCGIGDKDLFMNGDCEESKQLKILYKMFKFLKNVSDTKKKRDNNKSTVFTEVEDCLHFDTNLFSMYGPKQTLTPKERAKKVQDYCKEIDSLKNLISTPEQAEDARAVDDDLKNQLVGAMEDLALNFPDFKTEVLDIIKNKEVDSNKDLFSEDLPETLKSCDEQLKTASEFIKSMNVVTNFKENTSKVESVACDNKTTAMMRELADLCNEISALKS